MKRINFLNPGSTGAEEGTTVAEYSVMLALVAISVAGFGDAITGGITGVFSNLTNLLL